MSNTRIYLVAACIGGMYQAPRLIEAGTAAAARNHATKDMLSVKPASAKEVAKLLQTGVKLESAVEAPPEQMSLDGAAGQDDGTTGGAGLGSSPELPSADLGDVPTPPADAVYEGDVLTDEGNVVPAAAPTRSRRRRETAAA